MGLLHNDVGLATTLSLAGKDVPELRELRWFHTQLKNKVSHILMGQMEETVQADEIDAADILCEQLTISRSGPIKGGQPIGLFFLLGHTGKIELTKALADFLFNEESFLIRFDMSVFKEEHSATLLYGAPPGYIGYEEGGTLVNKIREKPYSVALFVEIEKAHPSVFDLFLQILDEGKLTDRLGKVGDFSNAVVLFTSNIGQEYIIQSFQAGEIPKSQDLMEIMAKFSRPKFWRA